MCYPRKVLQVGDAEGVANYTNARMAIIKDKKQEMLKDLQVVRDRQ